MIGPLQHLHWEGPQHRAEPPAPPARFECMTLSDVQGFVEVETVGAGQGPYAIGVSR